MGVLTGFYKSLMKFSLFRNKAKARLLKAVTNMDAPESLTISELKRYWLNDARRDKNFKLKPGVYKADLMINNEVLPECQLFVILEINTDNTFVCHRRFLLDDIDWNSRWQGNFELKGSHLHLNETFYFSDTVIKSDGHGNFILSVHPKYGPHILFNAFNKMEIQNYKSSSKDF